MIDKEKKKQVIGLFGEMCLAKELHERGWQVHRSYIDEGIDFVISKYFCSVCEKFSNQYIKKQKYQGQDRKCVTNLCERCQKKELEIITKNIQVKASEGIEGKQGKHKEYSFHPKIRYNMGSNVFYAWIAVVSKLNIHYYIFSTNDVKRFDNIDLPTYKITDNQKTTLRINEEGNVLNNGRKHSYSCFKDFHNNFSILETYP